MPSLLELQERFVAALQAPSRSPGIDVYRHAIDENYRRALGATYRVVRAIVGTEAFDAAVDAFVAAHPPMSGDLNVYGGEFATFVEHHHTAQPYLADIARLEWAFDESSRAAEAEAMPQEIVAALTLLGEDAVGDARLALHPSCRFVATRFPVYATWSAQQQPQAEATGVSAIRPQAEWLMTRRENGRTVVERLESGEFAWLEALGRGASFSDALQSGLAADAVFDLERTLHGRIYDGTIGGVAS